MTDKERDDYYKLSPQQREDYDYQKRRHPNWSHNQIIAKIMIDSKVEDNIIGRGGTVDPDELSNDPTFLKQVLEGAKAALYEAGIFIAEVFEAIDNAITSLGYLIMTGVRYIGDKLREFWDWLTS